MKATIESTGKVIKGRTLRAIHSQVVDMLSINGPKELKVVFDNKMELFVSLQRGASYLRTCNGNTLR